MFQALYRRSHLWVVLVALMILAVAACSDDVGTVESSSEETTTTTVETTTTTAAEQTTTSTVSATTTEPWSDVPATIDTVMVHGSWTDSTSTQTGEEFTDGVEVLTIEYSEVLEMSDPRASGATDYTSTLFVRDIQVGGTWVNEEVTIVNDDGTWVGHAMGAYVYTDNMPNALTTGNSVIIGEWHLVGAGGYEGLRLDFYNSSDGVIGSIRPVE